MTSMKELEIKFEPENKSCLTKWVDFKIILKLNPIGN